MDTVDRLRIKLEGLEQLKRVMELFEHTRQERDRLISRLVGAGVATAQEVAEICHISRSRVYQLARPPALTVEPPAHECTFMRRTELQGARLAQTAAEPEETTARGKVFQGSAKAARR
jgi:DNA-binding CsgD family transcriptional regulator